MCTRVAFPKISRGESHCSLHGSQCLGRPDRVLIFQCLNLLAKVTACVKSRIRAGSDTQNTIISATVIYLRCKDAAACKRIES